MNTNKKLLLLGFLCVIAVLLVAQSLLSVDASANLRPKQSPTPEILANGWYRFTDLEVGYSFNYPPKTLSFTPARDKGEKYDHVFVQFSVEYGYGQGMIIYVEPNPKRLSVDDFLLREFRGKWSKQSPPSDLSKDALGQYLTIGQNKAIKTSISTFVEIDTSPFFVFIENDDKIIAVGPMYNVIKADEVTPEAEELFMQIINTFTFNQ